MSLMFKGSGNPFFGKKHTDKAKQINSEKHIGHRVNLGRKATPEQRETLRQAQLNGNNWMRGRRKELHPNWKNGIHRDKHVGKDYEDWRKNVFERDNYTCQKCGRRGGKLNAHHLKDWSNFPALRYETDNGITLCEIPCHKQIHFHTPL